MTRRTYVYDSDLDAMVQVSGPETNHPQPERSGVQIIRDIDGYKAVGSDVASGGEAPWIGSRARHREYLRDNAYVEVGNEAPIARPRHWMDQRREQAERVNDVRRAMGDFGSRVRD